ncbi:MAG: fibrillarin-like rRNA/tRNA 2'-O-methyltransferase [Euryarchaeota archaeon]|nr:fibrillarin-like rRNA/tRNA 2'-O-methyltransferase [Euryarchaeota archaeon]
MDIPSIHQTEFPGVFTDGTRFYTLNSVPGNTVYGEKLVNYEGEEYREWSVTRSKLAAYIYNKGQQLPLESDSSILYLGAANGTTASHIADIAFQGTVYCVEFSPRSFRDLVILCEKRPNMIPILANAFHPSKFAFAIDAVSVIYQDISQKGQWDIFSKNMNAFSVHRGMLVVKSRSENVVQEPREIYEMTNKQLISEGFRVTETVLLDPMERDHAMMVIERI